jgi:serine/threonine protein phosphatase 1
MRLGEARTPEDMRLYAIGDVHGCDALLAEVHAAISGDLAARPVADHRIVHVGDYVDRGPDSAAVIERLARLTVSDPRVLCLRGNHDQLLVDFLAEPAQFVDMFLGNGGGETLASYGVEAGLWTTLFGDNTGLAEKLAANMPAHHRLFLETLALSLRLGGYFFCHAGVRPGVPLDDQEPRDLLWIRDEFLYSGADFGAVIIHGHTPAHEPEVRPNRINIDTGAVFGGRLTVLALEGAEYRFL